MRKKLLIIVFSVLFFFFMFEVNSTQSCTDNSDCNDGNPCTDDVCIHLGIGGDVCSNNPNSASCDDGVFCNGTDICGNGSCSFHSGNPCPSGTSCNEDTDSCDKISNTFSISGYVMGDILEGVSIQLAGAASTLYNTGTSGYYEFSNLNSGYYNITPKKDGYGFEPPYHVIQNLPSNLHDMNFVSTKEYCFAESIYGEDSEETELLRCFRDNILSQSPAGQELILLYYQWSPVIIQTMEECEEFKKQVKRMIDEILLFIEETPE